MHLYPKFFCVFFFQNLWSVAVEAREAKAKEFTDFHMPLNIGGMNCKMSLGNKSQVYFQLSNVPSEDL